VTWRFRSTILALAAAAALMAAPSNVSGADPTHSPTAGSAPVVEPSAAAETLAPAPADAVSPSPSVAAAPSEDPGVLPADAGSAPDGAPVAGPSTVPAVAVGGGTGEGAAPAASPASVAAAGGASPDVAGASPTAQASGDPSALLPPLPLGDDLAAFVLGFGMLGVAAIALLGLVWLALGRERSEPLPDAADRSPEAILAKRAMRRASLRQPEDAIVAALGIAEQRPDGPDRPRSAGDRADG
jgi:hypothetical protein